jgi:hypothetical protein
LIALSAGERRKVKPTAPTRPGAAAAAATMGLRVGDRGRQRFLAEHVLAGAQGGLGDLPVQIVGDRDADGIDLGGLDDGAPIGLGAGEPVAGGRVGANGSCRSATATSRGAGRSRPKTVAALR